MNFSSLKHGVLLIYITISLLFCSFGVNSIFSDKQPDLYFNGFVVGLQQDTYAPSACTAKAS